MVYIIIDQFTGSILRDQGKILSGPSLISMSRQYRTHILNALKTRSWQIINDF